MTASRYLDWNVGGGGAMRSVCPWTSSFRKMDSSDDRELIFGLEWGGWYVVESRSDEFISKKMDSPDDRELIFGLECW